MMSGGKAGGRAGDRGSVRIKRAGSDGWESREEARSGVLFRGIWTLRVFGPAIVMLSQPMRDIHDVLVRPGDQVMIWKKQFDALLESGRSSLREVLMTPELLFEAEMQNRVVNTGLDHILDVTLSAATQITAWFVGLTDNTPVIAAGDTMASHVGWSEFTEYSEATRVAFVDGGVSGQSVDNSASTADFSVNNDTNGGLGGLFLTDTNTKGGATGLLFSGVAITGGNRVVNNGDTVQATYTFTAADDGV